MNHQLTIYAGDFAGLLISPAVSITRFYSLFGNVVRASEWEE